MDLCRAHELIEGERDRIKQLLTSSAMARADDLEAAADAKTSVFDSANPLAHALLDDAVAERLNARLAALDRASERLRAGTYGVLLRSGLPIPDERLEADPAAELIVDEVGQDGTAGASSRHADRRLRQQSVRGTVVMAGCAMASITGRSRTVRVRRGR
jgi:RNA polymerase-binding transcription factor DksA